jgi:hypothetical protein
MLKIIINKAMKNILLLSGLILISFSCKEKDEKNQNFFTYQGEIHLTPTAYYGVEADGIELTISSFNYDDSTNEYSGSGSGVDFVKIKSDNSGKLPIGTFHSFETWGDTLSAFIGIVLINVDTLYSGNYDELDIKSGTISISESDNGYLVNYEIIIENGEMIKGEYEGNVIRN